MSDTIILTSIGINIAEDLDTYEVLDRSDSTISIKVKLRDGRPNCPLCGNADEGEIVIKDYLKKKYSFVNPNGMTIVIHFLQRRYCCKACKHTFLERNPFINNHNYKVTKEIILNVINKLGEFKTVAQIALELGVSDQTVFNIMDNYIKCERKPLPEVFSMDEFCGFNSDYKIGKYPCVLLNTKTHELIDAIRTRKKEWIEDYFANIDENERNKVKYVVIDMYQTYKDVISKFFKNAKILIDPFHYISYVTKAMDLTRIEVQRSLDEDSCEYKLLKKYRGLLRSKEEPDDKKKFKVGLLGRKKVTQKELLTFILEIDPRLSKAYDLCHYFLKRVGTVSDEEKESFLKNTISRFNCSLNCHFISVSETFSNWFEEILNSLGENEYDFKLSNGPSEGMNNLIKKIKAISFGQVNFKHMRIRIFLIHNKSLKNDPIKIGS